MLQNIQAFQFLLQRHPQRHEGANQFQQDEGGRAGPQQGDGHTIELDQQLLRIALDQAGRPPIAAVANTPANGVPVNPPTPWTPNTSSESS